MDLESLALLTRLDLRCMIYRLTIELFGHLAVRHSDQEVTRFRTQKTASLLAYLACSMGRDHPREELIELFWPEVEMEAARSSLRTSLASLRRQLEPPDAPANSMLIADRQAVRLNPETVETDTGAFESALQRAARAETAAEKVEALSQAVELYRGPLLPGYYEDWVLNARQRFEQLCSNALCGLVETLESLGAYDRALPMALRRVAMDPLTEEAHLALMRLYAASGQTAAVRRQFRTWERLAQAELDDTPSPEAHTLLERLLQSAPSGSATYTSMPRNVVAGGARQAVLPSTRMRTSVAVSPLAGTPRQPSPTPAEASLSVSYPTPVVTSVAPTPAPSLPVVGTVVASPPAPTSTERPASSPTSAPRLPLQLTRFFGREQESAQVQDLLYRSDVRLLTLSGPGGTGKTRLAIELARRLTPEWQGAVWFVSLSDLPDADLLLPAIAKTLGVALATEFDPVEQIAERLGNSPALLILDNFEQLPDEATEHIHRLLARIPALTCLITSRHRLGLGGEQEFPLAPLPTPPGAEERSETVRERPTPPTLTELLAFASVQMFVDRARQAKPDFQLTPANAAAVSRLCHALEGIPLAIELTAAWAAMLTPAQILQRLNRRFDLLISRRKDLPERHRTLRATLDWSFRLLSPALQRLFARLSVFHDGWTLEAAEAVCELPPNVPDGSDQEESPTILEALAQLQGRSLIRARESGSAASAEMRFRMLETMRDYAKEVLDASPEANAIRKRHRDYYLALAEEARGQVEGAEGAVWLDRLETEHDNLRAALDFCLEDPEGGEIGLTLIACLQRFWFVRGYAREGREYCRRMLAHPGAQAETKARGDAWNGAGNLAHARNDNLDARQCYEASLAIRRTLGDRQGVAASLGNLGSAANALGDYTGAKAMYEEALAIKREIGYVNGQAITLICLANLLTETGDYAEALPHYGEALKLCEPQGNTGLRLYALRGLGEMRLRRGEPEEATRCFKESLRLCRDQGDRLMSAELLERLNAAAILQGQHAHAALLYGATIAHSDRQSDTPEQGIPSRKADDLALLREALGTDAFESALQQGKSLSWEQAIALALNEVSASG